MDACVYVVQADNGEVKVGLSGTPYARLSKVKKEYSHRRKFKNAYLVGFVPTDYGLYVESIAGRILEEYAVGGEWYEVNSLIALRAVITAASSFENDVVVHTVGPVDDNNKLTVKTLRKFIRERIGKDTS